MQAPKPTPNHDWLRRMVGEWTSTTECFGGPDKPAMIVSGRESVRALGDLWIIADGRMEMPGGEHQSCMMLGFDTTKNKFVGTFVASMMTMIWNYEGQLDPVGRTLTLDTTGPSMMPGADPAKAVPYRDAIEIVSDDERIMTSATPGPDGNWFTFMTMRHRRVK